MSRYKIQSPNPNLEIVVGWDSPLNTYFCIIEDLSIEPPENEEDEEIDPIVLWVGSNYDEVLSLEDLCDKIADYATIPSDILDKLKQDSTESFKPSFVQSWVRNAVESKDHKS